MGKIMLLLLTGTPFPLFSQEMPVSQHMEGIGDSGSTQTHSINQRWKMACLRKNEVNVKHFNFLSMEASYEVQ